MRYAELCAGWGNYFRLSPVRTVYRAVDVYARYRLRQRLRGKHKRRGRGTVRYPDKHLYDTLRFACLPRPTRDLPWAKA